MRGETEDLLDYVRYKSLKCVAERVANLYACPSIITEDFGQAKFYTLVQIK